MTRAKTSALSNGSWLWMVVLLLTPSLALAQSTTSGSVAGTVKDATGAVLPGVTVEAASPALIEKTRTGVTDAEGNYKIIDLVPGTYAVTFTLTGFSTVKREGLELTTGFTATVNAEMKVGALTETITVTGASPVVDIQNVNEQTVLSGETWDALPTGKTLQSYVSLTLGAVQGASSQDVGGTKGDQAGPGSFTFHGAGTGDSQLVIDGMNFYQQTTGGGPWTRTSVENTLAFGERTIGLNISAEQENAGVLMNLVPREGGNSWTGMFALNGSMPSFQSSNLNATLMAEGVTAGGIQELFDAGGGGGGPIRKDKVWFFASDRWWNAENIVPASFYNATPNPVYGVIPVYTPNPSQPGVTGTPHHDDDVRLTWQAAEKQKVTGFVELQSACTCFYSTSVARAPEATEGLAVPYPSSQVYQANWTYVRTSRLLFQAGTSMNLHDSQAGTLRSPGTSTTAAPLHDLTTGLYWNAPGDDPFPYGICCQPFTDTSGITGGNGAFDQRFSMSYVTGSHSFKVGAKVLYNEARAGDGNYNLVPGFGAVRLDVRGGVNGLPPIPSGVYELLDPIGPASSSVNNGGSHFFMSALYGDDQWTLRRVTLNLGLRYDGFDATNNTLTSQANQYVPSQTIAGAGCSPCWNDIDPRVGVAVDVFGTGKTAIKGSVGRYVVHQVDPLNGPAGRLGYGGGERAWNPPAGTYALDCDLANPLANGACGPLTNVNRGLALAPTTFYDPSYLAGFDVRPYVWASSLTVQQELRPGLGLSAGYFNTWYGNLTVTANRATPSADFSPFCVTAPVDPRLGAYSGQQECGLDDLNPAQFGQVNNYVTHASNYGKYSDVFNGVDIQLNARFGRGGVLQGGVATGQTYMNTCAVLDNPQEGRPGFCSYDIPWLANTQVKLFGSYPLRWGLDVSATFQNLAGPAESASKTYTSAQLVSALGRPLSEATGTVSVALLPPDLLFQPRFNQLDLRLSKAVQFNKLRARVQIDGYNLFNSSAVLGVNTMYASAWLVPTSLLSARILKLGVQMDWR